MSDSGDRKLRLYQTCFQGFKQLAIKLINPDTVSYVDPSTGDTPLHQACKKGWLDVVKIMIEKYGCAPNVMNKNCQKPMHYACQHSQANIVQYLISIEKLDQLELHGYVCELLLSVATLRSSNTIAAFLCQNYLSSEVLFNDGYQERMKSTVNLISVIGNSKFGFHSNIRTVEGDRILQLAGNSKLCISYMQSALVLKILNNCLFFRPQPIWKTADGDNLCELMSRRSKTYTSSQSLLILLTDDTTIAQLIEKESQSIFDSKTAEFDTLFELVCTSEMIMSRVSSTALSDWLQDITLADNQFAEIIPKCKWKTADGDTLLQLMCQNESCLSRISSLVFVIWLRITPLYHINISLPDSRTADGDSLLQLVCHSGEDSISRISSAVLLKWLGDTTLDLMKVITHPGCKTADGGILFELICQLKTCIARLSSAEFLALLKNACITSVDESIPDCETIDHDTILQLVLQSQMSMSRISSKVLLRWLNSSRKISVDQMKLVRPIWNTLDRDGFLHVLCNSKLEDGKVIELIKYYWLKGVLNPNVLDSKGNTALHIACQANKPSLVSCLLINARCDPCIFNISDSLPLDMTANPEIIECLCQHPKVVIHSKTISRWINKRSVDDLQMIRILEVLLDIYNHTDILHLILNCDVKSIFSSRIVNLVAYLLNVSPDCLDITKSLQLTSNPKIMKMLLEHGAKMTKDVVFKVILSNHIKESEARSIFILAKNNMQWTPNDLNSDGETALHLACIVEKPKIVDYLLTETNCNPNAYDKLLTADEQYYESPLEVTTNLEIAKMLIEHGARVTPELVLRFEAMEEVQEEKCKLIELMLTTWNPSDKDSNGYTALHLACKADNPAMVSLLLSVAHCDPNSEGYGKVVPLQMIENPEIIKDLIRYGAKASAMYKSHGNTLGTNKPVKPPVKIFIVGNPSAGKSTLTAALKKKQRIGVRFFTSGKVSGVDQKTVGIVPHEIENDAFGKVTLYDFAGHREFYSGHAALLQTAIQSTPPIFLLVVNLSEDNDAVAKNIIYWISFLENQCASVNCKPHIIIVGSHADSLRSNGINAKNKLKAIVEFLKYSDANSFINMELVGFVAMDCQFHVSSEMSDLRHLLIKSCNELRTQEPITFNAHCFLVYLLDTFKSSTAVTINTIYNDIENRLKSPMKENVLEFLPENFEALYKICLELNDRGHILLLRNREKIENSYIVIDKAFLLTEMSGTVFAPEGFKQYTQLSTNTGVVPHSKLADSFPEKDLNIVIGFLNHLEFCHEIADQALYQLISEQYSEIYNDKERYYLFPALISINSNHSIWKTESQYEHNFGWSIRCVHDKQFFSSRFLQVLLLRLAFSFAKLSGIVIINMESIVSVPYGGMEYSGERTSKWMYL